MSFVGDADLAPPVVQPMEAETPEEASNLPAGLIKAEFFHNYVLYFISFIYLFIFTTAKEKKVRQQKKKKAEVAEKVYLMMLYFSGYHLIRAEI